MFCGTHANPGDGTLREPGRFLAQCFSSRGLRQRLRQQHDLQTNRYLAAALYAVAVTAVHSRSGFHFLRNRFWGRLMVKARIDDMGLQSTFLENATTTFCTTS